MDESKLLEELTKNGESHKATLVELMAQYETAKLGDEMNEQRFRDICNRVLAQHEFFADRDCEPLKIKRGDRITDESNAFLMSEEDFHMYCDVYGVQLGAEEGFCDENGYCATDWVGIKVKAMNDLTDFIIDKILPSAMRPQFAASRRNVTVELKLIDILKGCFKAA